MLGKHRSRNDQRQPSSASVAKHELFDDVIVERARLIKQFVHLAL
jgi:hypothetical protein